MVAKASKAFFSEPVRLMKPKIPAMLERNQAPKPETNKPIVRLRSEGLPDERVPFTLVASRSLGGDVGKSVRATEHLAASTDCETPKDGSIH